MSEKASGCLGCLGSLVILTFIGSIFFGGGVLMRVGGFSFVLGRNPIDRQQIINNYFTDLEYSKKIAESSVQKFHTQLEQGKCQDIYDQANELFKKSLSQSEMVSICAKLKQEIGTVNSAQITDWWGQPTDKDSENYILLRYITVFSKSSVRETFIWLIKDDKPELVKFEINPQVSNPELQINPHVSNSVSF
ncbi:DUF4019 domain-containing protein [Desmonostoc muscorum LEGE 12446]|uniref:DUF4019 domain-containing protein n=1 Tax=Desmonostoc muscorum LEGE 12446 TaxID=1828758 RepID=A0A8J6ZZ16_DESMC|nr:DUF4019 domain-containing protein [Desmonostoc muscorum]MCF2145080.1 DUF4019 domain-containing protein [Desmonostoc muscorum LEGE 12446]